MTDSLVDLRRLVEGLYLRTLQNQINWTYDQSSDSCEADLGSGYVQVVSESDEDGDYFSYVKVLNASKQVVDRIYGGSLGNKTPYNTEHTSYWKLLEDLKKVAERSALGADQVVSSILSDLNVTDLDVELPF